MSTSPIISKISVAETASSVQTEASQQLKDFLSASEIVGDERLKTTDEWKLIRGYFAQATAVASKEAQDRYIENTEETTIAGVPVLSIEPKRKVPAHTDKVIVYIHGGIFTLGSADHLYQVFSQVADETGLRVIAVNYRLAPEHPFPAALEDCVAVYEELLKTYSSEKIAFLGDSVGGNLCVGTAVKAKEKQMPQPGCLALFSPLTSAHKGESYESSHDPRISYEKSIAPGLAAYVEEKDKDDPYVTILNADLSGLAPIFAQTGTRDALRSDSVRLVEEVQKAGGAASLLSMTDVCHGIVEQQKIPEADQARHAAAVFIQEQLGLSAA